MAEYQAKLKRQARINGVSRSAGSLVTFSSALAEELIEARCVDEDEIQELYKPFDWAQFTVDQLKEKLNSLDVEFDSKAKKDELIELLNQANSESE
jgi:hypothetical protein